MEQDSSLISRKIYGLDKFLDNSNPSISQHEIDALFTIEQNQLQEDDEIQGTLPMLKKEWIVEIRPLNLKPNDYNYDPSELIYVSFFEGTVVTKIKKEI